jgi:hypothetical protein
VQPGYEERFELARQKHGIPQRGSNMRVGLQRRLANNQKILTQGEIGCQQNKGEVVAQFDDEGEKHEPQRARRITKVFN